MPVRKARRDRDVAEKPGKYPLTKKAYTALIRAISKKYGVPQHLVDNTIRQKGLQYTLEALSQYEPKKEGLLTKLAKLLKK